MPLKVKGNKKKQMNGRKRKPQHKKHKAETVKPDKGREAVNNRDSAAASPCPSRPGERVQKLQIVKM